MVIHPSEKHPQDFTIFCCIEIKRYTKVSCLVTTKLKKLKQRGSACKRLHTDIKEEKSR